MAFLFILGGLCVNAAELTINFNSTDLGNTSSSYVIKAFDFTKDGVTFNTNQLNPSTGQVKVNGGSTTTTSGNFYIYNKTALPNISKIEIAMKSGNAIASSKSNLVSIRTADAEITDSKLGTDLGSIDGTTLTLIPSATDKSFFRIDLAKIGGTVKFESMTIYYGGTVTPSEPVAYEPNFADVEIWEGNTAQIELGSKHPTSMIFVPEDETVASVDENGLITAHKIGSTTVTVSWDADDNFLAATEDVVFSVNVVEKPLMFTWTITGIETPTDKDTKIDSDLKSTGAKGTWHVVSTTNCYSATDAGAVHLGSGSSTFAGSITLGGSDIPANATITKIAMSAKGGKDASSKWSVSVNGETAAETLSYTTTAFEEKEVSVNLAGNEIVLTCVEATANKAVYINGITVYYDVPAIEFPKFEGTEHSFTTESSEIRIADADHAFDIFYRHTPAPAQNNVVARAEGEIADSFENKAEFDETNGQHVIPVSESGTLSYYAVHTATGKQSETNNITVTKTATTAIDAIGADNAEGEAEFFDIRGVKVNIDNAAPGLYIRRQGTAATKVVVK